MSIYVVSDLHGASDALKKAIPEASTLLLLGDLINLLDYTTMTGILTEVFSEEAVIEVNRLRASGDYERAREVMRLRAEGRDEEIEGRLQARIEEEYEEVFDVLPDPTYLILGNVDHPRIVQDLTGARAGVHVVDAEVIELEGERFGFVGGGLPTPLHVAGEVTAEELKGKLDRLGEVDVLCTHVPPAVPELCYDTLAKHSEQGSAELLAYIREVQPRRAYFGHVHQPLVSSWYVGGSLCVNVGYFRRTKRAWPHRR